MSKKYLYYFSEGNDAFGGDKVTMKNTLGGKGAGLAEMTAAGMPVPQGFTITTDACTQYYADGRQINDEITADIFEHLKGLEKITGKKFGDNTNPLLVSVRSGARQSMPGMMDTILNLGLNDEAVEGLAKKTGNTRFAYDCYRRFVQMFADVVMMVPKSLFEVEIDKMKEAKGVKNDVDLTADDLKELVGTFKKIYEENEGRPFPQDPRDQLIEAVKAVFRSWDNPRANVYRKMNEKIDEIKYGGEDNNTEQVAGALLKLPRFLLRFAIGCLRVMDYFGIIPQKLLDASPFHGSMIITDMGSLGIPPIYHHLYNFGTLPMFIAFGAKRKAVELDREGKAVERKYIDFMAVMDERVCDGYYYACSFKYMRMFMHNRSLLEVPHEIVVEDLF